MSIIWISSYPKSGNTWVRFLVANLLYGKIERSTEVRQMVPDIHETIVDNVRHHRGLLYCKTHYPWSEDHPHAKDTTGFIHIVRHPLDVLASLLNYFCFDSPVEEKEKFIKDYLFRLGSTTVENFGYGTWPDHGASWKQAACSHPGLFLHYEGMKQDPLRAARAIGKFLQLDCTEEAIQAAVEATSFRKMKAREEAERSDPENSIFPKNKESDPEQRFRFLNRGESGVFREFLSTELVVEIEKRFEDELAMMGYGKTQM